MLIIRRYTPADQAAVEFLHVFAMQQTGAYLGRGPWDDDLYAIEEHYLNAHGEFLLGEIEGRLVTMGAFRRTSPMRAEIMRMRVHPDYQGQGFGLRILSELETRARARGYTTLHLHTSTVQIAAQKLYEKHGFREVGRETYHGLQIILYEKEIAPPPHLTGGRCINDSAGKFCPDKWTRKGEEGRVEGKDHEEVLHDEVKEEHNVAARPTARTDSRSDQSDRSCQFSQGNAGDASARCTRPDL